MSKKEEEKKIKIKETISADSPDDDNDEVEQIPAVPQVGIGVEEQAVGYHLQERLHGEDDEEQILHALLRRSGRHASDLK